MVYYLAERTLPHKSGRRIVTSIKIESESSHRMLHSTHAFVQEEEIKGFLFVVLRFYTCGTTNLYLTWPDDQQM